LIFLNSDPAPYVYFNALGESSLDFRLLFWTSYSGEWIRIRSEVMFKIHDILQEEGISIPFPQMDLHLRSVDKGIEIINKIKQ
jgi:small-conductance mechanosensitive channel